MGILRSLDKELFYLINGSMGNPLFDQVMPWFRNMYFWFPLYALLIGYIIYIYRFKSIYALIMVALTVVISDQLSGNLIKKNVKRIRPCNNELMHEYVTTRVTCGSGFSFPSAHASNHFALAVIIIFLFGKKHRWFRWAAPLWAASVAFAQVYVGVHFPIDVTAGALLGSLVALLCIALFKHNIISPKYS